MGRRSQGILVLVLLSMLRAAFQPSEALAEAQVVLTVDVTDESGAVIPGAQIKLTKRLEDQGVTGHTDSGDTVSLHLTGGSYQLSVSMNGFKTAMKQLDLINTAQQTIVIVLRLGGCPSPDPCPVVVPEKIEAGPSNIPEVLLERREARADVVRTTICEVVSSPGSFDGKTIEVRASVSAGLETNILYDKSCLQDQLPSRILFIPDEQTVERTGDYRKFWRLVRAYREPKGRRRSMMPDKYTVAATFIGRFNTVGATGQLITSRGILAVRSVRDVVAQPFDGSFLTGTDAKSPAKQTEHP